MKNWLNEINTRVTDVWINVFWKNPNHLWALKVTVSIAALLIPAELIFNDSFISTTLALGVVAMALGETDVHPRGRVKSALISLILFFIISALVELFFDSPVYFSLLILIAAFTLTIVGGLNSRMQGVTFGALLIFVYTMLGADETEKWFYQPVLYTIGAFAYSLISILLLRQRPYRLLKEQLARGFHYLAEYIDLKANLFPSDPQSQTPIRNQLAQKNIDLAQQIESCKNHLYSYSQESGEGCRSVVNRYYQKWFLLQEMQERAISSHEQYDLLSREVENPELIEGYGQLMREIARAIHIYADSLLTDQVYKHPISLQWTLNSVQKLLEEEKGEPHYLTLSLLIRNLMGLERNLREEETIIAQIDVTVFNSRKPENSKLSTLLKPEHPRFKSAVRLTLSWLLGFWIIQLMHIDKGAWILLTSLIVFQQTYSATRMRLFHRVFGTLMGVILGVTLSQLLPTLAGQILLLLISIYLFFYWVKKNYVVAAVFITVYVLASFNLHDNQGVAVMLPRIVDTLIGGMLAYLVVRFVWPDWQYKQLPKLMFNAVNKNKRYFESIYKGSVSEEDYLHNRRTAYNADNSLAAAWKGMRLEPRRTQMFQESAFNLTNLNHALLSYISAFGVHKHAEELTAEELKFCEAVSYVLQFVVDMMKGVADVSQLKTLIISTAMWEEELEKLQMNEDNKRAALIYNIAHVSRQLLIESQEIV
ncbi:MAG: FUSC family membrane protein [Fermentimonas sp.]|nr:FUSC family membrane protein [Fermentimonas sp.]